MNTHTESGGAVGAYPASAGNQQDTRFKPGRSGNPAGRVRGTRNRASVLAEKMIDGQARDLVQKAIDMALAGNPDALRLCIARLLPPRKDRPVRLSLGIVRNSEDAKKAHADILNAVATGVITPDEGAAFSGLLENYRKSVDIDGLEKRLADLETMLNKRGRE